MLRLKKWTANNGEKIMSLKEHAKYELEKAGLFDKDSDYNGMIGNAVMELIEKFSEQGHSGFFALIVIELDNLYQFIFF